MWYSSKFNLSHVIRKSVLCERQRRRSACTWCSLISVFVVRYLDSTMPVDVISKIPRLLSSNCSLAGRTKFFLVGNPKDRFSFDVAHLRIILKATRKAINGAIFDVRNLQRFNRLKQINIYICHFSQQIHCNTGNLFQEDNIFGTNATLTYGPHAFDNYKTMKIIYSM